jgi:H+/Cl- antiporter ClcA
MGGALADQFNRFFRSFSVDRKTLMGMGVASGFAAVFGTPWAGLLFGFEVLSIRKSMWKTALLPMALAAWIAHLTCLLWGGEHTEYALGALVSFSFPTLGWLILAGVAFGATAWLFTAMTRLMGHWWGKIGYPPLRPFLGGLVLMGIFLGWDTQQYAGLGVDQIVAAFSEIPDSWSWLIKLGLTAFTLGAGFKGGEVTPLFFVGATLGSVLSGWIPLPIGLLAGMGFIAVFSGASHAPLACIAMGIELFGLPSLPFIGISSVIAYLVSGPTGMYSAQRPSWIKSTMNQLIPAKES